MILRPGGNIRVWVGVSVVASRDSGSDPARLTRILFSSSVTFLGMRGGGRPGPPQFSMEYLADRGHQGGMSGLQTTFSPPVFLTAAPDPVQSDSLLQHSLSQTLLVSAANVATLNNIGNQQDSC